MPDNNNLLSYFESRIISIQAQINNLQELVNHYRAVLADFKRQNRIDYPIDEFQQNMQQQGIPKEDTVSL
ncbi:MAG TPA: hypothetical protein VNJ07_04800 [Chitinophagales bacterium]|nr:hypothetical protein [Chitinophagales bacterium]